MFGGHKLTMVDKFSGLLIFSSWKIRHQDGEAVKVLFCVFEILALGVF
jgi:hypothetical protein